MDIRPNPFEKSQSLPPPVPSARTMPSSGNPPPAQGPGVGVVKVGNKWLWWEKTMHC